MYVLYSSSAGTDQGSETFIERNVADDVMITKERAQNRLGEFYFCANLRDAFVRFP